MLLERKPLSGLRRATWGLGKSSHKVKECAGRTKKTAMKIPSGRPASATPSSPDSPNSAEEVILQTTPQIPKRKRSSPSRVSSSVPEDAEQSKTARPIPECDYL